jgi:hypothetical protein
MDRLRLSRFLSELRYAYKLTDEAGIQNGWVQDKTGGPLVFHVWLLFRMSRRWVPYSRVVFATR